MNLRLAIYALAAAHRLDGPAVRELSRLAGLAEEPAELQRRLARGVAVLAAALGGFGVILWIAANWASLGRFGQFALLQGLVLAMCAAALWRPAARRAAGLLALLGIGGLFAYFGQTYQTGADPWQLFALWAALALPLCLAARSDVLWLPWTLVTASAIALWTHAHAGHRWQVRPDDLLVHGLAWGAAAMLVGAFLPAARRFTGAGPWALRAALTLAVAQVTLTALGGLFHPRVAPHYGLGLALLAVAALPFALRRGFDAFALSALALGLNVLLVAGLARRLFDSHADHIGALFLLGIAAAVLLAGSVSLILRLQRREPEGRIVQ